jgi:acetoacetate decarboxylase
MFTKVRGGVERVFGDASPKRREVTRQGRTWLFELPQFYEDWTMMMAHFPASASRVRGLLPSTKLQPVQIIPGLALVTVAAFEYRHAATLAPYNEVAMMIPVRFQAKSNPPLLPLLFPHWFTDLGFYIFRLPVTTQEACDIGIEIWGFPKFVADIKFHSDAGVRRCSLQYEGKHVLTLEHNIPVSEVDRSMDFLAYPVKDREFLKTLVQTKARYAERRLPFGASCTLGDHPIADELRGLGMWRYSFGRLYGTKAQSLLNGPSERVAV